MILGHGLAIQVEEDYFRGVAKITAGHRAHSTNLADGPELCKSPRHYLEPFAICGGLAMTDETVLVRKHLVCSENVFK